MKRLVGDAVFLSGTEILLEEAFTAAFPTSDVGFVFNFVPRKHSRKVEILGARSPRDSKPNFARIAVGNDKWMKPVETSLYFSILPLLRNSLSDVTIVAEPLPP